MKNGFKLALIKMNFLTEERMSSKITEWPSSYCLSGDNEVINKFIDEKKLNAKSRKAIIQDFVECCVEPNGNSRNGHNGNGNSECQPKEDTAS